MIKILFVFGTRPEAIKMAPVIQELKTESSKFKVVVCVTAQHREMLDQVLELFSIMPDYDLDIMTKRQSLPNLTARVLIDVTRIMENENPDIVFVQGDTTTTFTAAQAAFYLKIPVAHIEAGLRTGNRYSPFPEEINRRLTSVMTDFHFAPTKGAEKNLILEGVEKSSIFITGNTGIDALMAVVRRQKTKDRSQKSEVRKGMMEKYFRERWNIALTADTDKSKLILVTGHRRESFGKGFQRICKALRMLAGDNPDIQIVYPVHLNPNVKEPVYSILGDMNNIHLISPLDYEPFVFLMSRSYLILTDSGGIQEEAPSLGVPVLVMRDTTERPDGIEAGSAKLVGTDTEKIITETQKLLNDKIEYDRMSKTINPYGDGQASKRIVRIISEHFRRCK
ncbi:UDP-N-acetylglucosamine 2-epimerase (non-hydrolyzing) [Thermodesulfovibrionales bacterium]|nr:UDP-N-acetylglucosamine 2-epimerase (non-hydrolyzing) [Thermodesulfovibrionales bacterium]